jgi:hypothetical protein
MTKADTIASHGRVRQVSALSIASLGRLYRGVIVEAVAVGIAEIVRLVSRITTILGIKSEID